MRFNKLLLGVIAASSITAPAYADSSFVVRAIQIVGLHQISQATALNYLPIKVGDTFTDAKTVGIIQKLYATGFFENVSLSRSGNTLIVNVVERGVIGTINIVGNKKLKEKDIRNILNQNGIASGSELDHAKLDAFKQNLIEQYNSMARYNASVTITTSSQGDGKYTLNININEGSVAKVRVIQFNGNSAFSKRTLLKQFVLTTPKLWSFITHNDEYSKPKLDASLDAIKSFYLDRGYLHFQIISATASLSADKKNVDIVVTVSEGPKYTFSGFDVSGNTILPKEDLMKMIDIKPGDVFSRQKVIDTDDKLGVALGDKGYAFAQIEPIPTVNENTRQVYINFLINPGHKVYVRRITYSGNTVTADNVMRFVTQQMEGSLISVSKIRDTVQYLNNLGFFKDVNVKTTPVPGTTNQVDLDFNVKETPAGQASVGLGYGTLGFELNAGINQPNFLGTGRTVGINFSRSQYLTSYGINYYNPFYTTYGIGRGFTLTYQRAEPGALNLSRYTFNTYGGSLYYIIPLSRHNSLQAGAAINHIDLNTSGSASTEILNFVKTFGNDFNQVVLTSGWTFSNVDKAIFPTKGFSQSLGGEGSIPASKNKLEYYKINYAAKFLQPLNRKRSFIVELSGNAGFGNGYGKMSALPFFVNYYAGGLAPGGEVRGYETNTLGPRDSTYTPIGGNFLTVATAALIFPNPYPDSVRTAVFVDAGNVFQTVSNTVTFGAGAIRYSAGLGVEWRSPLGPLSFSLARAINKKPGDNMEPFQFSMSTSF